jgi:hypothetical protein
MRGNISLMQDIGNFIKTMFGGEASIVAAGAGDNTEVNGPWIDREGFESLVASIGFTTTLTAAQTLALLGNLQDADDIAGTGAADFGAALSSTVVATGAGTVVGTQSMDFSLAGARRYVRVQWTPNLSAGATDTARLMAQYVMGGAVRSPVAG